MVEDREKIKHDCTLLAHAMEPTLRREIVDSQEGMLYRLALDTLFARLNWIGHRISNDLITIDDVPDLQYWMRLLARWPYAPKGMDHSDVFVPFLKSYGYDQTLNMMRLFGIPVSEAEKLARDVGLEVGIGPSHIARINPHLICAVRMLNNLEATARMFRNRFDTLSEILPQNIS
jgi:hypothetical protein